MITNFSSNSEAIVFVPTNIGADENTNPYISYVTPTTGTVTSNILAILTESGRSGVFFNPLSNGIAFIYNTANTLISETASLTNNLTNPQREVLLNLLQPTAGKIQFFPGPPTGSIIEVVTPSYGNDIIPRSPDTITLRRTSEFFYAANLDGAQTTFNLSSSSVSAVIDKYTDSIREFPTVYLNSVYQRPNLQNSLYQSFGAGGSYTYIPPKPRANSLVGCIQRLQDHTNRLSGLVPSNSTDTIDLEEILSLGIALNTLNQGQGNNNVLYCMSALFSNTILYDIANNLNYYVIKELRSSTANASLAISLVSDAMNTLTNIVDSDLDYFAKVQTTIRNSTLSSFIESSATEPSGKYLFRTVIGTDALKQVLKL